MDRNRILRTDREEFDLWFAARMEEQGKACAICRKPFGDSRPLIPMVDHDARHCGNLRNCAHCRRGLLCGNCNIGIGMFGEDIAALARAIAYLESSRVDLSQPGYTKHWGRNATWEHRPDLKLDMEKAREMRRLRAEGMSRKDLMARFGVSLATVKSVISGQSWKEPAS